MTTTRTSSAAGSVLQVRRNNVVPGTCLTAGGVLLAVASNQAWVALEVSGLSIGSGILRTILQVGLTPTYERGSPGETRTLLLALAIAIGVLGLILITTRAPYVGVIWRIAAALAAVVPVVICAQAWRSSSWTLGQAVGPEGDRLLGTATSAAAPVAFVLDPAPGLFLMSAGLILVGAGVIAPSRRTAGSPIRAYPPAVEPAVEPAATSTAPDPGTATIPPRHPASGSEVTPPFWLAPPDRLAELGLPASLRRLGAPHRLPPQWAAALGGTVLLLVTVWALTTSGPDTPMSFGPPEPTGRAATASQRACIIATEADNRTLFEEATSGWRRGPGPINFSGVPAYTEYADAVAALDLAACPAPYAQAYQNWDRVWRDYGGYLQEMTKPHFPWNGNWSTETIKTRRAAYDAQVRTAYQAIRAAAGRAGVSLPARSWIPAP